MYQYGVPDEGRKDDNILKIVHIEKQTVPIILKNKIDMAWESLGFTIMQNIFKIWNSRFLCGRSLEINKKVIVYISHSMLYK